MTIPTNEIYAAAVSQMLGDTNLEDPNTNFNPAFVNGNTIEVVGGGIISVPIRSFVVGAILANQNISNINLFSINPGGVVNLEFSIGSIAGDAFVNKITGNYTNFCSVTLTGSAGAGGMPVANHYSALQNITFQGLGGGSTCF